MLGWSALFAFYFLLVFVYPAGMGFGDVKLAGVLGLYLGWLGWGEVVGGAFLGFLLGGVVGVALMVAGPGRPQVEDPVRAVHACRRARSPSCAGGALADLYLDSVLG